MMTPVRMKSHSVTGFIVVELLEKKFKRPHPLSRIIEANWTRVPINKNLKKRVAAIEETKMIPRLLTHLSIRLSTLFLLGQSDSIMAIRIKIPKKATNLIFGPSDKMKSINLNSKKSQ